MAEHINFYENLTEAHQRLLHTLIMYDGIPCKVVAITDHRAEKSKVFSIYLLPIPYHPVRDYPANAEGYRHGSREQGEYLDNWMKENKESSLMRKHMNSPKFNRFRPFPLGMMNDGGSAFYMQRQPQRTREAGLSRSMVLQSAIAVDSQSSAESTRQASIDTEAFRDCILGKFPSYEECIVQLKKPDIVNKSVAFHRNFAIIRGPLDLFFLNYKGETVGLIQNDNQLLLGKSFKHFKEVTEELNVFRQINIQS